MHPWQQKFIPQDELRSGACPQSWRMVEREELGVDFFLRDCEVELPHLLQKVAGDRRVKFEWFLIDGVRQADASGVEHGAGGQRVLATVKGVSQKGAAGMGGVDANLVGASGEDLHVQEGGVAVCFQCAV